MDNSFRERLLAGLINQSEENHYYLGRLQFHRFRDGWACGSATSEVYDDRRFPTIVEAVLATVPDEATLTAISEQPYAPQC